VSAARVAAIDIGTNSVLLLIASTERGSLGEPVLELATITRLGEGVDRTRRLTEAAVERTLTCLASYAEEIARHGVVATDVVGTSAMRDAEGGEAFRDRAEALLGVRPRVVSGDEEARLTFEGALVGLEAPPGDVLVFDVGGGSTEIVHGRSGQVLAARSLDVGSVRLTERHVATDPPTPAELEAVRRDVRAALATLPPQLGAHLAAPQGAGATLIGVAGTVTSMAAIDGSVEPYDATRIHGARLDRAALARVVGRLASMPLAERQKLPGLSPKRADVIIAGAVLCEEIAAWADVDALVVSDRGVRWGLAGRLARGLTGP
jgi:exopolyphosphatase/guanosine-5'-triphosphate,3'-diphosphate pyrophosphatase